jgi:hypothetical protein
MARKRIATKARMAERHRWTLEEPHRSRIERGLAWAAQTEPKETKIDDLLKRRQTQSR